MKRLFYGYIPQSEKSTPLNCLNLKKPQNTH